MRGRTESKMKKKNVKTTILDVAKRAGVSKATVSNYLNGRYEKMAEETKETIQKAIEELDYIPSLSARRLSAKESSKTIGLIIPGNMAHVFDTMYYPIVFSTVGELAEKEKYSVLIYAQNSRSEEKNIEYLMGLAKSMVDGFLITNMTVETRFFKEFERNSIPHVCLGKIEDIDDYQFVATDHEKAVELAVDHLVGLEHKQIALLTENKSSVVDDVRWKGYRKALKRHGIEFIDEYCHSFSHEDIRKNIQVYISRLLEKVDRPTAFIVPASLLIYLKQETGRLHLNVPEDLSIVCLEYYKNNFGYVTFQNKKYTRVESVVDNVCKVAFDKLMEQIHDPSVEFHSYFEPVKLLVGETTGKPGEK